MFYLEIQQQIVIWFLSKLLIATRPGEPGDFSTFSAVAFIVNQI